MPTTKIKIQYDMYGTIIPWLGSSFECSAVTLIPPATVVVVWRERIHNTKLVKARLTLKRTMVPAGAFGRFAIWGLKLI